jgi:hypothetical protein
MSESSPVLREPFEPRSRDGTNTILHKEYRAGHQSSAPTRRACPDARRARGDGR